MDDIVTKLSGLKLPRENRYWERTQQIDRHICLLFQEYVLNEKKFHKQMFVHYVVMDRQ